MFRECIQKMVDRLDPGGSAAGVLMGFDGLAVDGYARPGSVDVQTMSMELTHVIAHMRRSLRAARLGGLDAVEPKTDRVAVLVRIVTDSYFVVFGVAPDSNLGKARYLLRLLAPQIRALL